MNIVILGPQGSGKGTQAKLLSEKLGIPTASTGQAVREAYEKGTKDGIEGEKYWGSGKLVPIDLVEKIFVSYLKDLDTSKGVILDGYPRSFEQYERFNRILEKAGLSGVDKAFLLTISKEETMKRLLKRAKIEGRKDDTPERIEVRLNIYEKDTKPIISKFRKLNVLEEIDGERSIEEIHKDILSRIDK